MEYIIAVIIGYLFGCLNTAYIVAKIKGIDIKKVGTSNAGASNVFISVGKIYGVIAGAGDIFKSFLAAMMIYLIYDNFYAGILAGAMAVIGHIFPFWMKFKGGKGLASFMGLILFYGFDEFAIFGIILIIITLATDYIASASLTVATLFPIYVFLFDKNPEKIVYILIILAIVIWYKHKDNILRMKNGTEFGFLRKNKY